MTYEQALAIVKKYMAEKHPDIPLLYSKPQSARYGNESAEYTLVVGDFECVYFWKQSVETASEIFTFIMPATKEEFLTLMEILDR